MSLMNDALRKKECEDSGDKPFTDVFAPPPAKRKARKWFFLLAVPVVLAFIVLAGMAFLRHRANDSLLAGHPPVKRVKGETPQEQQSTPQPSNTTVAEATAPVDGKPMAQVSAPPMEEKRPEPPKATPPPPRDFEPGPISVAKAQPTVKPIATTRPVTAQPIETDKKPAPSSQSDADLFYRKAVACHRGGRLTEAARFYNSALASDANHRQAMANLATVYIEQGNSDQALPLLEHLEKADPIPDGVLLNLAIVAMDRQAFEKALDYLDRAQVANNAPAWQIRFHRAAALAHLNRLPEALALYQKVETQRPDDYRVKFNLALAHDALGDYPQALAYYGTLLKGKAPEVQEDRPAIVSRVGVLRRYLNQSQSQEKRQ